MSTYRERRKDARRIERTVPVCLRGDLVAEWEAADRELKRLQEERTDSKEGAGLGPLIEKIRGLEAEMREHTDEYVLRAMPRYKFRKLIIDHPPRLDGNGDPIRADLALGVNRDTFFPELIKASVVSPELDEDDWRWLFGDEAAGEEGVLTDRQFGDLEDAAWFLNRAEVDVPFSHAASLASRNSAGE
jgi:hypothetical protein